MKEILDDLVTFYEAKKKQGRVLSGQIAHLIAFFGSEQPVTQIKKADLLRYQVTRRRNARSGPRWTWTV